MFLSALLSVNREVLVCCQDFTTELMLQHICVSHIFTLYIFRDITITLASKKKKKKSKCLLSFVTKTLSRLTIRMLYKSV